MVPNMLGACVISHEFLCSQPWCIRSIAVMCYVNVYWHWRQNVVCVGHSYMEMNVRCLYRLYNVDVPVFLRNRPRRLIDDWRKKMRAVQPSEVAGVRLKSHRHGGIFLVPARGTSKPDHEVCYTSLYQLYH